MSKLIDNLVDEGIATAVTIGILGLFAGKKQTKMNKAEEAEKTVEEAEEALLQFNHIPQYDEHKILETVSGDYKTFEEFVNTNETTIGLIVGARGTGKSAIALRVLENVKAQTGRNCMAMGFNAATLPNWIKCVENTEDLENDSFIVIDEGGVLFSSRSSMSGMNKMISSLILVARHKNISILFITQNSSNLDINIIRQSDYLVLKPASLLQLDFERPIFSKIYEEIDEKMKKYKKENRGLTFIYNEHFRGFINNSLASFWGEDISKNFKEV